MSGLRIVLIHNLKPPVKSPDLPADYYSECDSSKTVQSIVKAIESLGHKVTPVEADRRLPEWLAHHPVDLAFNIAEGFDGEAREARIPALLELMDIPYTGCGVLALALALDKARSKQLFRQVGVPTPNFQIFMTPSDPLDPKLHYPLIVKPNREGSAKGIWASSVVQNETALRLQVEKVQQMYKQEVLVEEFIDGLELTVGILGAHPLPILEVDFSECRMSGEYFYSWRMKEFQGNKEMHLVPRFWCPGRLSPATTQAVHAVAVKAALAIGYRDIARVDIRLSPDGIPYVLEVNPLPGLDPEESNLPVMVRAAGMTYEALLQRIVDLAVERNNLSIPSSDKSVPTPQAQNGRALPASREKGSGSPGSPATAVRSAKRPQASRNDDPKEEDLGR